MGFPEKTLVGLSVIRLVFVLYSYASSYLSQDSLEQTLQQDCPTLSIHVIPKEVNYATISSKRWINLIAWYDTKNNEEIFITPESYREYKSVFSCDRKRFSAYKKLQAVQSGEIELVLKLKVGYSLLILLVPFSVLAGIALKLAGT